MTLKPCFARLLLGSRGIFKMDNSTLKDLALLYDLKISKNKYMIYAGRGEKILKLRIHFNNDDFLHFTGLEHIPSIKSIVGKDNKKKRAFLKRIKNGHYTYDNFDQEDRNALFKKINKTFNPIENKEYTIEDRINKLFNIEQYLENVPKGALYKWNVSKCDILLSNGTSRQCSITADYLLTIPLEGKNHNLYLFLCKKQITKNRDDYLDVNVISVFPDGVDLARGQEHNFTILKYHIHNQDDSKDKCIYDVLGAAKT